MFNMASTMASFNSVSKKAPKGRAVSRRKWRWEEEELTRSIVNSLQQGQTLDTRMFLRPIFKWSKVGLRRNGQRDEEAIEKAFAFVDWMVQLSQSGDSERNIAKCASIQPSYALNTLITSSQRAGSLPEALRAFNLLLKYGYDPDVFAYTALIDATARAGEFEAAIRRYDEMRASRSKPNIVTFTTIIRAMSHWKDESACRNCLRFLDDAQQLGIVDQSLFSEALQVCDVHGDEASMMNILSKIQEIYSDPEEQLTESFVGLLAVVAAALNRKSNNGQDILSQWREENVVNAQAHEIIQDHLNKTTHEEPNGCSSSTATSHGCLGHETSSSVREAVVHHDLLRLKERIQAGTPVTNHDFETLIHQCRKRKWKDQVDGIRETMVQLSQQGCEEPVNFLSFPAQKHLAPTKKTFVAMMDAFLSCGDQERAWQTFEEFELQNLQRDVPVYRKFIRGSYLLNRCDHILALLASAVQDKISLPTRVWVEIARVHGNDGWHNQFLKLLEHEQSLSKERKQLLMEELIKACAYRANHRGILDGFDFLVAHGFKPTASTEMAVLVCCLQQNDQLESARNQLHDFQSRGMALTIPVYDALLHEFYTKCTGRSGVFDERSRKAALKALYERRGLFEHVDRERDLLQELLHDDTMKQVETLCALQWCCYAERLSCASILFAQHVVQQVTMIRDKQAKEDTHSRIQVALSKCQDPLLFVLRTVCDLSVLDFTYRSQGKIAKEILRLMAALAARDSCEQTAGPNACSNGGSKPNFAPLMSKVEQQHVKYCFGQIESGNLTIHLVKELDEAVGLFRFDVQGLVEFCVQALEKDNLDKTVSFLLSRTEFFGLRFIKKCLIKLADLFVFEGVMNVLQYFKQASRLSLEAADIDELLKMKRFFVRAIIARVQENMSWESSSEVVRKTIFDLELQHEDEFLPFVTAVRPVQTRIAMDPELLWAVEAHDEDHQKIDETEYLKLPLADDHVVFVNDANSLNLACRVLMHNDSVDRIGIDAEWRPEHRDHSSRGSSSIQSRVAILQLACDEYAFVFDLLADQMVQECAELFAFVFSSEEIVKLGYGLDTDLKRLRRSFPQVSCFDQVHNTLDFATKTKQMLGRSKSVLGLSAVCKQVLGLPLCKYEQKSDWEARPLRSSQLTYAALDAFCLVLIHDKVSMLVDEDEQVPA